MALQKAGGTLTANTNAEVLTANYSRQALIIQNLSSTDTIFFEFGTAASTTAADDSFALLPQQSIILSTGEWPDAFKSVNLKSTGTPQYLVRESNQ